ncbi:MBL fold metallo-hydrolase [Planotetraspora thailandica]|uniref:MBL fold metallo-hydrolase n=1 Tax=Planotetraspora thailandica TaxID=487172 RepID=A0A8J3V2V4_9ACTN|nr:MBL fold metallo-hydrolase [Planotetraspora thailandica]GII55763.1 MBL fold metallo-hydrolase [Planotetraspora thailandica]
MKLTKLGHACWRMEKNGSTLVLDPGAFSGESLLDGADAVLITHEHFDHVNAEALKNAPAGLEIWTCQAVADQLGDIVAKVQVVRDTDAFTAAGFDVKVIGEWHAVNLPGAPLIQNVGFLVDEEVFYPGDALTVPQVEVPTLLVPTTGPWVKLAESIQYLRDVRPARAYSTHDGLANDIGYMLIDNFLSMEAEEQKAEFRRVPVGEFVEIG